jgi:hypothetical protein
MQAGYHQNAVPIRATVSAPYADLEPSGVKKKFHDVIASQTGQRGLLGTYYYEPPKRAVARLKERHLQMLARGQEDNATRCFLQAYTKKLAEKQRVADEERRARDIEAKGYVNPWGQLFVLMVEPSARKSSAVPEGGDLHTPDNVRQLEEIISGQNVPRRLCLSEEQAHRKVTQWFVDETWQEKAARGPDARGPDWFAPIANMKENAARKHAATNLLRKPLESVGVVADELLLMSGRWRCRPRERPDFLLNGSNFPSPHQYRSYKYKGNDIIDITWGGEASSESTHQGLPFMPQKTVTNMLDTIMTLSQEVSIFTTSMFRYAGRRGGNGCP